jgi:hypothetical protein
MDSRQERISMLSRVNRGIALRPRFLSDLSIALGIQITHEHLLPLAQTDLIRSSISNGYGSVLHHREPSFRRFFSQRETEQLSSFLACCANTLKQQDAILHTKNSEFCGAISHAADVFVNRFQEVIQLDGDSLSVLSKDGTQGLVVDFNADELMEHYEVVVWGDRWPIMILSCIQ